MLVGQSRVEDALRERLASLGVAIEWATRLRSFDQRSDGVHVVAADRNGKTRALRTRWLVGCDGAGSTVRREAGISFLGKSDEEDRVLVGDLVLDGLDRDHWHMWPKPSGTMLGLCPLPTLDAFQLQAIVTTEFGDSPTLDQVRHFVADWTGRSDIRIQSAPWLSLWRSNVRMVNRYRAGRVFLAGDAAHVHPAAGGLGMNTGMQDAYNLGWKIAATIAGAASDALLDTYEAERLPVAADVLGFSSELHARGATGIFSTQGQPSDTLQLGISYRGGPLSFESPAGAPALLPGDRAPDGLGVTADGEGRRLFDVFRGTHVTALMFGGRKAEVPDSLLGLKVRQVVVQNGSDGGPQLEAETLRDEDGSIHEAYAAKPGTTVVIRPDGYMLSRAEPGETAAVPAAFAAGA
jgi:2-polyprenyl-6-methoxyphenol hydroxylase-like FAD-dependent oxidoreductase